ncbi:hypothetical protein AgCh_001226 [Apium graveolens]
MEMQAEAERKNQVLKQISVIIRVDLNIHFSSPLIVHIALINILIIHEFFLFVCLVMNWNKITEENFLYLASPVSNEYIVKESKMYTMKRVDLRHLSLLPPEHVQQLKTIIQAPNSFTD